MAYRPHLLECAVLADHAGERALECPACALVLVDVLCEAELLLVERANLVLIVRVQRRRSELPLRRLHLRPALCTVRGVCNVAAEYRV